MSRPKAKRLAKLLRQEERRGERAQRSKVGVTWQCPHCAKPQYQCIPALTPVEAAQSEFTVECHDCGTPFVGEVPQGGWTRMKVAIDADA